MKPESFKLPPPGTLLVATRAMRAWENDLVRGEAGDWIMRGERGTVVECWTSGLRQVRVRLLHEGKLKLFSSEIKNFYVNWQPLWSPPEGTATPEQRQPSGSAG